MNTRIHRTLLFVWLVVSLLAGRLVAVGQEPTYGNPPEDARTIRVNLVVLEQAIMHNRLGAHLPNGQMYALERDVLPSDHPSDAAGNDDLSVPVKAASLQPGMVRLRSYKRPRPVVLRASQGDILEIRFRNLLPASLPTAQANATVQIFGLQWLSPHNGVDVAPGETHTFRYYAANEGVFMMMSPNGNVINPGDAGKDSHNDFGLFGAVNVQPKEAEFYRSQVTREDLRAATYRVNPRFLNQEWTGLSDAVTRDYVDGRQYGLPEGVEVRARRDASEWEGSVSRLNPSKPLFQFRFPAPSDEYTPKVAEVEIGEDGHVFAPATGHRLVDYQAVYPLTHPRAGTPILNMLKQIGDNVFELVHTDLTALITGPNAERFPFYLNSPSFRENSATPDRRQPYREFSIFYHFSPLSEQAFAPFQNSSDPLYETLQAGKDAFAINYGIAGIGPEIYANRINRGPQGFHKDGVDLKFEEFFLSAWSVGDPAILVDVPACTPIVDPANPPRAQKALYPDDPSNVYHSYMRDHVKFRVLNTGSVAPHVHHQHAHQWLHSPDSDDSHYLDSQMINPGSTYTMEMTYHGSGNRNQTVGDSIFHCHIYPHFAQGMWSLWRVHDVFEEGTELEADGRPVVRARALPDGEIERGTPIPALVPLPTIGMAPLPAEVRLVDGGRRAEVISEALDEEGKPAYRNPGFPFFIPGVAGHRAPHPPMDFAWKEDAAGNAVRITEETADAFHRPGELDYLDGGLPRHVVLDGEVVREFHTRWDFSKDFAVYDEEGNFIRGSLEAVELPDEGTPVEQAAMRAHATRTHATPQPNGLPGAFVLNGLPPVPGAPYAAPDVDDNGNSNFLARRYQAAVVQTDVVFNKEGWHYPQQRFITLLDDVKDTISGKRPPQPFFFRANTGETIEFWHTNLVPAYYELDDYQVRTPTDIIGQHIHLVKFDVTASDGAGNGFNYEDGTFSPDEVRDRINAINAAGGLYHFNGDTRVTDDSTQDKLTISSYEKDYGGRLGKPPTGQDWNGAQTTIQRFDTDSLLNNEGEDRTLRTVFTHDHFGPSTHQQVGLYGALLVEPAGSKWVDAVTGEEFPERDGPRTDGGPTSWQAIIETRDSVQSYREFAIAVADLQLAYQPQSKSEPSRPDAVWFSTPESDYADTLNRGEMPAGLRAEFAAQGAILSQDVDVSGRGKWKVTDDDINVYALAIKGPNLEVRTQTIEKGWADPNNAIWAPQSSDASLDRPTPTIISDPGGGGNVGGWMVNYRNEPLDARVQDGPVDLGEAANARATDPAFAFSSIPRKNASLNVQPKLGAPIAPGSSFRFPELSLLPQGDYGVRPEDPYTPLLRAYANDNIEVRTVVGAVDSVHSFRIQGNRWNAEPSYPNSGFRDVQGFGISEHFEMLFQLPPGDADADLPISDYLYAPSTSTMGLAKGSWGLLRSYRDSQLELAEVSNNPVGPGNQTRGFYRPPANATVKTFDITMSLTDDGKSLQYSVNGHTESTLVLRANAGDWLKITVYNELSGPLPKANFTSSADASNQSANYSSDRVKPYVASSSAGLHSTLLSYNTKTASGMNVGLNGTKRGTYQTVAPGEASEPYYWYAGAIDFKDGKRTLTPIEFGGVNLLPADPVLQQSYGLFGVLVIEPVGAIWDAAEAHQEVATIRDKDGNVLFTEVVLAGNANALKATARAGAEVRFRVLNSGNASPGNMGDGTNVIIIDGHDWQEEPYQEASTVIGSNPLSQAMGTQQVTPLETYNLVLPSAGGVNRKLGSYKFFYYPTGNALGTLQVTP